MLRMSLGPTTPYCVTEDHMIEAAQLARAHKGVRLHTHLAENDVNRQNPHSMSCAML